MMVNEQQYIHEAGVLVKYLTGRSASPEVIQLYIAALKQVPVNETDRQHHTWEFCMRHPRALKYLDAALAYPHNYHVLRKRIYIMLAILETQSAYSDCFLPQKRSASYMITIAFRLGGAIIKMIAGKILLWFI